MPRTDETLVQIINTVNPVQILEQITKNISAQDVAEQKTRKLAFYMMDMHIKMVEGAKAAVEANPHVLADKDVVNTLVAEAVNNTSTATRAPVLMTRAANRLAQQDKPTVAPAQATPEQLEAAEKLVEEGAPTPSLRPSK